MHKNAKVTDLGLRIHVLCFVAANLIQILVWWQFTPELHFWPVWSIVGWGAGLVAHIWAARPGSRKLRQT
jgi:hypothetical protein